MEKYLGYLISLMFSPILFIFIGFCSIYRCCIEWILFRKYGKNFGGILNGIDARVARPFPNKHYVNILYLIDFKTNDYKIVCDILKEALKPVFECKHFSKLTSTLHHEYGYYFLKKNQYKYNEAVVPFDLDHSNKLENIQKYFSEISTRNMLGKWNSLIEFQVCKKTFTKNNRTVFPIILKYQHCLADGLSFIDLVSNFNCKDYKKLLRDKESIGIFGTIKETIEALIYLAFGLYLILRTGDLRHTERNLFHNRVVSGEQIVHWISEDEENLTWKIRMIRKKTGATFTQIIQSAIAASLKQFSSKKRHRFDNVTVAKTFGLQKINADQLPKLTNTATASVANFSLSNDLKTILRNVMETDKLIKESIQVPTIASVVKVMGTVMPSIFDGVFRSRNVTFAFSNLGQPNDIPTTFLDYDLLDYEFNVPTSDFIGLMFGTKTYSNRLSISATVDRSILDNVADIDEILKNTFNNIEQLYKDVTS